MTFDQRAERGRLLLYTTGLNEPGGMAKHGRLLAAEFEERGWEVKAICRMSGGLAPRTWRSGRLHVVEVPGFGVTWLGRLFYLPVAFFLGLWWTRSTAAILALQLTAPAVVATGVALLRGRPVLLLSTLSGPGGDIERALSGSGIRRSLLARATRFVAQTPAAEREILSYLPGAATSVVPTPVARKRSPEPCHEHRVLFTGRLVPQKNLAVLLRAWPDVVDAVPDAELVIAGTGPPDHVRFLKRLASAEEGVSSSVHFVGWIDDVDEQLAASSVFVLPSLIEGMSNSLVEACSAKRVVVASDIEPNRAVLGMDYGLLFPPTDVRRLADSLVSALTDDDVRRTCLAEIEARVERFYVDSVVDQLEELLCGTPDMPHHKHA